MKGQADVFGIAGHAIQLPIGRAGGDRSHADRGTHEHAGLVLMDVLERRQVDVLVFSLNIEHLSTDHSEVAGPERQFLNDADLLHRLAALHEIRPADQVEGHREQRVARQDRHRFAIDFVVRRFSPAEVVVVHRRQVVVNQRVGMNEFQRAGDCHEPGRRLAQRFRRGNRQNRPYALAACHQAVAHALMERGRRDGSRWRDFVEKTVDGRTFLLEIVFDVHRITIGSY